MGVFVPCTRQVARRYAEFAAAIVAINQSFPSDRVDRLMSVMTSEVEKFMRRMSNEFPGERERLTFLINNYDMILGVLAVRMRRRR